MPVRPAHWPIQLLPHPVGPVISRFSCRLCVSGRSAVLSSVQPADLLRPDSAALPVLLAGISGRHFFLNRATAVFPAQKLVINQQRQPFLERQFVVGLKRFRCRIRLPAIAGSFS